MGELVTDLLQARVGAERVAAVKALAKRKGMTMQSLVGKLIDEATGVASSHTDVIRPVDGSERLVELAERQVELLEQLVQELAKNPANSVVPPVSDSAENSAMPVVAAVEVDSQRLVGGVRAKSQQELEEWLNLPGSEEESVSSTSQEKAVSVVITSSPAPVEEPAVKRKKSNPAFAAALRAAAAAVVGEQGEQAGEQVPDSAEQQGEQVVAQLSDSAVDVEVSASQLVEQVPAQLSGAAVDSAVDVEVSVERVQPGVDVPPGAAAAIREWRQEQVGKEAPCAPPANSAAEWVMGARDLLRDRVMAGDLGEVVALLGLWQCPHDLMAGEVGELLAELPDYERL
jgi:predicted RNA-binding protein with PIN domain